jgi:hypothetical protein
MSTVPFRCIDMERIKWSVLGFNICLIYPSGIVYLSQGISEFRWPLQIHKLVASQRWYGEGGVR